jgi:flagellar basal-body rod modification protein FlgD
MIDGISGMGAPAESVLTPPGGALGKEEFLQLLVAQLRNQDPMNPMESQEFAAQLAQFSSVEQLINVNENLVGQAEYTAALAQAMNSDAAVGALGREVVAVGDRVPVTGGAAQVQVEVGGVGGAATVRVYDELDQLVAEVDAGFVDGGRQTLQLEGLALEDGAYRYEVEVTDAAGEPVEVTPLVSGTVTSVKYEMDGPVLMIGAMQVPLSAVVEVSANQRSTAP